MEGSQSNRSAFEEYTWMENLEDFDRQVEEELWEEDFIRKCIEQLLDEEEERETMSAAEILRQKKCQLQNFQKLKIGSAVQSEQCQAPNVNGFHNEATNGLSNGIDILVSIWLVNACFKIRKSIFDAQIYRFKATRTQSLKPKAWRGFLNFSISKLLQLGSKERLFICVQHSIMAGWLSPN